MTVTTTSGSKSISVGSNYSSPQLSTAAKTNFSSPNMNIVVNLDKAKFSSPQVRKNSENLTQDDLNEVEPAMLALINVNPHKDEISRQKIFANLMRYFRTYKVCQIFIIAVNPQRNTSPVSSKQYMCHLLKIFLNCVCFFKIF